MGESIMQCGKNTPENSYANIPGMDPRADWLLGPGIEDYLPDAENTLIPFIMRLDDNQGVNSMKQLLESGSSIRIPHFYIYELKPLRYFTGLAPKSFFDELKTGEGLIGELSNARKEIRLCSPTRASSIPKRVPGEPMPEIKDPPVMPPEGGWPPDTVVVGIIDDGIAFAHERFRTEAYGSRIECFWYQDGKPPGSNLTVDYGSEICKRDSYGRPGIDTLLATNLVGGSVDEERLYKEAGVIDFAEPGHKAAAWRASHGALVSDLAAGEDPHLNVVNRPMLCVQLRASATENTSGALSEQQIIDGIAYILERARYMAGKDGELLPVVINISYGLNADQHDGTSVLEAAMEQRLSDYPDHLRIVVPAGNSHLSRCHAEVLFGSPSELVELNWRVQPDDKTPSSLQVWLPHESAQAPSSDRMTISVETPAGVQTTWLGETHGSAQTIPNNGEDIICHVCYSFKGSPTQRGAFYVELAPTSRLHPTETPELADRIAPSGVWKIRLQNVSLRPEDSVQVWIQRDDTAYGYPLRGRQTYFDQPCYRRFDVQGRVIEEDTHPEQPPCLVKRDGSINAMATGAQTIVAGGFIGKNLRPAPYSAGGPITPTRNLPLPNNLRKPDAMLVSDDSKVHPGVLAAGSRSGSVVAFTGTSVAAPQLARWVADELANASSAGDRGAVSAEAQLQDPAWTPLNRGGWGRISQVPGLPVVKLPRYW